MSKVEEVTKENMPELKIEEGNIYIVLSPNDQNGFTTFVYNLVGVDNFSLVAMARGMVELVSKDPQMVGELGFSALLADQGLTEAELGGKVEIASDPETLGGMTPKGNA